MSGTKYDKLDMVRHVAEGRGHEALQRQAAYASDPSALPTFVRMVILEVVSDPATLDAAKLSHFEHDLGVSNVRYATVAPRNSVIARRVMGGDSGASEKAMVLYPFFPPSLALPAKPGEHVWAMFEHTDAKSNDMGYWICRIVQPNFVEDMSYTHADRQFDPSFVPGLKDKSAGTDDPTYEFRNGAVDSKKGQRYTVAETASVPGTEAAYEDLLQATDASRTIVYESVPRFRKRPGDTALEGSNNTLLVMGTDRTGPIADYSSDPNLGQVPAPHAGDLTDGAGSITVSVGRGQTARTGGQPATNRLGRKELGKSGKELAPGEGDIDLINDRTTAVFAQKTKPDSNFGISGVVVSHSSASSISDGQGEGSIVVKTDKVRIVARHDVVIMVMGVTDSDAQGNVKDPGTPDASKCASVILRTNGDIVFTPASKGVIKLGSDSADLAVLCAKATSGAGDGSGNVSAAPIVDSMGGSQGAGETNGVFATKVLLA